MTVRVLAAAGLALANLAEQLAARPDVTANDLEPWQAASGVRADGQEFAAVSTNHAPTGPHTDRWCQKPDHCTVLAIYRFGAFVGGDLCWDGGQIDLQHGDIAVIPAGLEHWNLPRTGDSYRRVVVAYRGLSELGSVAR